ncbi:tetratricopeptide repeat protein [Saccharothrix luteola]|uniref:tetratricopeptide repeat protein n=1 Tax=Saccharothrix luteola TaxID=2893018 RepID=UPI001E45E8DC|nr:tetratricopeptide repeat protein [Saccharothrix luteola]MCC8245501.1 tetratricopeptide repeat protein [Saccharothrix luteola]
MDGHEPDFGGELRRRRERAGHSLIAFAELIHYSKGYLSKVETGKAAGNREFAQACDTALAADGALLALMRARSNRRTAGGAVTAVTGLPPVTRHFTGRAGEREAIAAVLGDTRAEGVCVLSGMAGAGKTALALRGAWDVADRFPDGCLFLDLGGHAADGAHATAHDVLDPLLRLLGVPGDQIPPQADARANLYRGRLRGKRLLLVLDNAAGTAQVSPLVPAEPRCRVVITSRNKLNALDDAVRVDVGVLPADEAAALFRAVAGERAAGAPDEVVARVARLCGLLPLALRIAASRFRTGANPSLEDFERRLADENSRLGVLDDGERSVAAAFALSHRELPPEQARVFALLALHPGRDIGVDEVAALAGVDLERARVLVDRLGDVHLVTHTADGHVALHDLLGDFARALPAAEDHDAAVLRLLDHTLLLAESSDEHLAPHRYRMPLELDHLPAFSAGFPDRESAVTWLDRRWPTLVGLCGLAGARGLHSRCWQLAFLLRDYFFQAKLWDQWIDTHRTAAASARAAGDDRALAMTLNNLGIAHADRGELEQAGGYYAEAMELFREVGDEHGSINAESNLAWVALYLGDLERAWHGLRSAEAAYRRLGNERNAAISLRGISLVETELGRYDDAVEHADLSYDRFRRLGLPLDLVMSLNGSAWAHFRAGRLDQAAERYEQAVRSAGDCGSRYEEARARTGLGNVHAAAGRSAEAARAWARADELHPRLDPTMVGEARARSGG